MLIGDTIRIFQSTFPRGERHFHELNQDWFLDISIHVPAWGTTGKIWQGEIIRTISIHVPAWGTTDYSIKRSFIISYFNPRSRVGNDNLYDVIAESFIISIHVPAWGTTGYTALGKLLAIFQSTFPRGERPERRACREHREHFNPRSRVGNDFDRLVDGLPTNISIHVPAWGTTAKLRPQERGQEISIHVPAWGTTDGAKKTINEDIIFQSTFPRGERLEVSVPVFR